MQSTRCAVHCEIDRSAEVYSSGDGTATLRVTALRSMIWPGDEIASDTDTSDFQ